MRDLIPMFAGLVFPPACIICHRPGFEQLDLCEQHLAELPFIHNACHRCAMPLPAHSLSLSCGRCLQQPPAFDRAISVFEYRDRIRELVTKFKFHAQLPVARTMAELLWREVRHEPMPDVLLPVPLHRNRLRQRGFNQSVVIADMLARHTETPLWRTEVERVLDTRQQSGLDRKARSSNIRGAFAVAGPLKARHVAIVDDVITTGSTVNELAKLLKRQRVEIVSVWSLARAPLEGGSGLQ